MREEDEWSFFPTPLASCTEYIKLLTKQAM